MNTQTSSGAAKIAHKCVYSLCAASFLGASHIGIANAATPWFQDGLEYSNINEAISSGPWNHKEGDATLSTDVAHSGSKSLKICYANNESQSFLALRTLNAVPGSNTGQSTVFLRWWEYRPANYDWSGEKFNRLMGLFANHNVTIDYPLGWTSNVGWGQPGTNDGGAIKLFGNSGYSNGADHFGYSYNMPREEWHVFEVQITLGDPGMSNGEVRMWIDDNKVAEKTGIWLRQQAYTLDEIWMGGWYSGGAAPSPGPACRYIDDVTISSQRIGGLAPPSPPNPAGVR